MKLLSLLGITLLSGLLLVNAADDKSKADKKAKPYPLDTCVVSDEPLGGDHGEPYVFTHEGQEFKLCCEPCLKKFNKDPKSFHKKVATAAKGKKEKKS